MNNFLEAMQRNKRLLIVGCFCVVLLFFIYRFSQILTNRAMLTAEQRATLAHYPLPQRIKFESLLSWIIQQGGTVTITSSIRDSNDPHGRKHALDINVKLHGVNYTMDTPKANWEATGIPAHAISLGLRWGGNFKTPYLWKGVMRPAYDPVHFDTE